MMRLKITFRNKATSPVVVGYQDGDNAYAQYLSPAHFIGRCRGEKFHRVRLGGGGKQSKLLN